MNKTLLTTVSSVLIFSLFTNCGNAQKKVSESKTITFAEKAPFTVKSASYQNIIGGIPGSSETHLSIKIAKNTENIKFDSIYFNNKVQAIQTLVSGDKNLISASFFNDSPRKRDLIMDADPKKEMSNKVLPISPKIPFELSANECVISYTIDGKKKYYKIKNVKKGKSVYRQ